MSKNTVLEYMGLGTESESNIPVKPVRYGLFFGLYLAVIGLLLNHFLWRESWGHSLQDGLLMGALSAVFLAAMGTYRKRQATNVAARKIQ